MPHAIIIQFPGTNCDAETARALETVGITAEVLPVALLEESAVERAQLVVFAGGFSYGDYVMSGRIARLITESRLGERLKRFVAEGGYVLGICNGFQILTQLELLPKASLIHNTSGRFQCRWAALQKTGKKGSPFLTLLPDQFELPVAHAEGRVVTLSGAAAEYVKNGLAPLQYGRDINGSSERIAGLQDETGRVFGLMPHPERFMTAADHYDPDWGSAEHGWGYYFFKGALDAIQG